MRREDEYRLEIAGVRCHTQIQKTSIPITPREHIVAGILRITVENPVCTTDCARQSYEAIDKAFSDGSITEDEARILKLCVVYALSSANGRAGVIHELGQLPK